MHGPRPARGHPRPASRQGPRPGSDARALTVYPGALGALGVRSSTSAHRGLRSPVLSLEMTRSAETSFAGRFLSELEHNQTEYSPCCSPIAAPTEQEEQPFQQASVNPCKSPSPHAIPRRISNIHRHVSSLSRRVPRLGRGCRESVITTHLAPVSSMVGKKSTDNMASWTPEEDRKILQLYALEARPPSKRHHSHPSI